MRKFWNVWIALLCLSTAFGQSMEGRVDYQKSKYRAAVLEVPYPPNQVEEAFDQYLKKKGSPGTNVKGFRLYRNVKLDPGKNFYGDMYVSMERKSRKEKEATTISVIVGRPNETISSRGPDDDYGIQESKAFLNGMVAEVSAHSLNVAIAAQEDVIKKTQKKFDDMISDSTDLIKKMDELRDKMKNNAEVLKGQRSTLAKEKDVLEGLRGRKKE
jgi:hypothetical protein